MDQRKLNIGIAGLGTVGAATYAMLQKNAALYRQRTGVEIRIPVVSSRDRNKCEGLDFTGVRWAEDARQLATDPEVDVVLELIGGADGVALELVTDALKARKHVVTANKAMMAAHASKIIPLAERSNVHLGFEASVCGAIPIIKALREGLAANNILKFKGIMNGTCNYILTEMSKGGREFGDVLREAQAMGYAETPPDLDIDGHDAAHKLAIVTGIAFGCAPSLKTLHIEGIRRITPLDFAYAREMGYTIRLLGLTERAGDGILQRVHPCLVPLGSPLAGVERVLNAVVAECDGAGSIMLTGAGAGGRATASAVISDVLDIAHGVKTPPFGILSASWGNPNYLPMKAWEGEHYVRLKVADKPGVLAKITGALSKLDIGVETVLQRADPATQTAQLALATHPVKETAIVKALETIGKLDYVLEEPHRIRIEE